MGNFNRFVSFKWKKIYYKTGHYFDISQDILSKKKDSVGFLPPTRIYFINQSNKTGNKILFLLEVMCLCQWCGVTLNICTSDSW